MRGIVALLLLLCLAGCGPDAAEPTLTPTDTDVPPESPVGASPDGQGSTSANPSDQTVDEGEGSEAEAQRELILTEVAAQRADVAGVGSGDSAEKATTNSEANLRAGPGTNYAIVGGLAAEDVLDIIGQNEDGDWYQLADGSWIAAFLVRNAPPGLPIVETSPPAAELSAPAQPATSATPAAPVQPTAVLAPQPVQPPAQEPASQPFICTGGCATPPDPSCNIKGNVNSSGEKIYHSPGGQYYESTDIKPEEGDRWFCSSTEAQQAGFRPSQR